MRDNGVCLNHLIFFFNLASGGRVFSTAAAAAGSGHAALIKTLREETGAGLMDCRKAVAETAGDKAKALEWLKARK